MYYDLPFCEVRRHSGLTGNSIHFCQALCVHALTPTHLLSTLAAPACAVQPEGGVKYKLLRLGEVMDANRMATTPYVLEFMKDKENAVICEKMLSAEDQKKFKRVGRLCEEFCIVYQQSNAVHLVVTRYGRP
jgi:hypothetical protein